MGAQGNCLKELRDPNLIRESREKIGRRESVPVFGSVAVLLDGFENRFCYRVWPSPLRRAAGIRIAAQAACLDVSETLNSRGEIRRLLNSMRKGSVFLVLGHGGPAPCGGVAAKQAELRGELGTETPAITRLMRYVSPDVGTTLSTPFCEEVNALFQALKILHDSEFSRIIADKKITVAWAVCSDLGELRYHILNRPKWTDVETNIRKRHPILDALSAQMNVGLKKFLDADSDRLSVHFAHTAFVYDPLDMRKVLDPGSELLKPEMLELGILACVDSRVTPNTPDSPQFLFRLGPNETFRVTIEVGNGGLSFDDVGSLEYALRHVKGLKVTSGHGEAGNGHVAIVTTDITLADAESLRNALILHEFLNDATSGGSKMTLMGFGYGRADIQGRPILRIKNDSVGVDIEVPYSPKSIDLMSP